MAQNSETFNENHHPEVKWWVESSRSHFKGFWFKPEFIKTLNAIETQYKPISSDIILASFPKTGTTWLKALTTSILSHSSSKLDPLLNQNPHQLVPFLEIETFGENPSIDITKISSPRVFNTHFPYSLLPENIKNSNCRIIYIARNPADTFVSLWHYYNNNFVTPISIEEAFDEFCRGYVPAGPYFEHVLEYWNVREKENVFFVTYEELKQDTVKNVKRLADFLGGSSVSCEDIEVIAEKCSIEKMKKLEANNDKAGVHWSGMKFSTFFRQGVVGDWKNHLTVEMVERLHQIANEKWAGFGLESRILMNR